MGLDQVLTLVLEAIAPHLHGRPRVDVDQLKREVYKTFAEEPHVEAAFIAAVQAVAKAAKESR